MPSTIESSGTLRGLTSAEAEIRLKQLGPNQVSQKKRVRPIVAFIKKFNSPLLLILIGVSIISFIVGARTNTVILLVMVLLSAVLDFVNSYKSEKAVDELVSKVVTTATVIRDGEKREVRLSDIVPGDIVCLSAGDVVPADSRVLLSDDFFLNQSALTGESFPVEKVVAQDAARNDREPGNESMVFMGTSCVTGFATVEVVRTGRSTVFGGIADRLTRAEPETDFEHNSRKFSMFIMRLTFVMVAFVFVLNALAGRPWLDSFIFAIAIAIGMTPELLPVIISVSLSHGSIKMAKKNVIVKNLSAIQNFGSMTILCTDKTGTLTKDRIEVVRYMDPLGNPSEEVLLYTYLNSYHHTGVMNPLDSAVKEYKALDISAYEKIDEIPFDFMRKRQSVVVSREGTRLLISKGAPEAVFSVCTTYLTNGSTQNLEVDTREQVQKQFKKLSAEGYRVLAVATRLVHDRKDVYEPIEEHDLTLIGFIAFLDPPKESARVAIDELEELGIEVKILTGDNELLTEKICRDIDIPIRGVVTGDAVSAMTDEQLMAIAPQTTIFARITPDQKERIIIILKKAGHAVGYLGDGINDAPALKAADVGISVNNAVDVAKETADIILLKKSLQVLKEGVIEGRKTFHNSMKYIMMGLSSNFGNMFSMMVASAFLPFLPMLPTQILLNNLLYDSSQLSLTTDHVDEADTKKPTVWDLGFIRRYMMTFGPISSLFDFITFGVLLFVFKLGESQFQTGWFIESLATQVLVIYIIRTKKLPFLQSSPSRMLLINTLIAVCIAWLIPYTPFGPIIGFTPLSGIVILSIVSIIVVYLAMVELGKQWFYRHEVKRIALKVRSA